MSSIIKIFLAATILAAMTASQLSAQLTVGRRAIAIKETYDMQPVWDDRGSGAKKEGAFWRPILKGYFPVGDVVVDNYDDASSGHSPLMVKDGPAVAKPVDYKLVWNSKGTGVSKTGSIWQPIPPTGFVAMGCVANPGFEKPSNSIVRCVRKDLVARAELADETWSGSGSNADVDVATYALFSTRGQRSPGVVVAHASFEKPKTHPCAYVFSENANSTEVSVGKGMIAIKVFQVHPVGKRNDAKQYCELHKVAEAFKVKYAVDLNQFPPPDTSGYEQLREDVATALDSVQGGKKVTSTLNTFGMEETSDGFTVHHSATIIVDGSIKESAGTRFLELPAGVMSTFTLAAPVKFQSYELGVYPLTAR